MLFTKLPFDRICRYKLKWFFPLNKLSAINNAKNTFITSQFLDFILLLK